MFREMLEAEERVAMVNGYDCYYITSLGKVISTLGKKPRILKTWESGSNTQHLQVELKGKKYKVHKLMAEAFLDAEPTDIVHHANEDSLDNRLENLEIFKTVEEHSKHHALKKAVRCVQTQEEFKSIKEAGKAYGIDPTCISDNCRGKYKKVRYNGEWINFEYVQ